MRQGPTHKPGLFVDPPVAEASSPTGPRLTWSFLVRFVPTTLVLIGGLTMAFLDHRDQEMDLVVGLADQALSAQDRRIQTTLRAIRADMGALLESNEITDFVNEESPASRAALTAELSRVAKWRGRYDQLRVLGLQGREVLRVHMVNRRPVAVPDAELQDKSDRYYFREALSLPRGVLYVSPVDLNVEGNQVEMPPRPVLRVAAPVMDAGGRAWGVLVLNYRAQELIDDFLAIGSSAPGDPMLVDGDGYWLAAPDPDDEWGGSLPGRGDRSLAARHPVSWRAIAGAVGGTVRTDEGLYVFRTLASNGRVPLDSVSPVATDGETPGGASQVLKLMRFVPQDELQRRSGATWALRIGAVLVLLSALGSWLLGRAAQRRAVVMERLAQSEEAQGRQLQLTETLLTALPVGVFFKDRELQYRGCNDAFLRLVGRDRDAVIGTRSSESLPLDFATRCERSDEALFAGESTFESEADIEGPGGEQRHMLTTKALLKNPEGDTWGLIGVVADVTERRRSEDLVRLYAEVFQHSADGIMITDARNRIVSVNRALCQTTGYTEEELIGRDPKMLRSELTDSALYRELWETIQREGWWQGEMQNKRKSGELRHEQVTISTVRDHVGAVHRYIAIYTDITERKENEERLRWLAHHDALTGLANRNLLEERAAYSLLRAPRDEQQVALLVIDLDRFKHVNDTLGHAKGDQLLAQVAERLSLCVRRTDTVARLGGDEFAVLLPDVHKPEDAAQVAEKIVEQLSRQFELGEDRAEIGASVGVSIAPDHGSNLAALTKAADAAMYRVKARGRNGYALCEAPPAAEGLPAAQA